MAMYYSADNPIAIFFYRCKFTTVNPLRHSKYEISRAFRLDIFLTQTHY